MVCAGLTWPSRHIPLTPHSGWRHILTRRPTNSLRYDWFVKNPGIPQPRAALLGFTPAGTGARPGGSGPMSSLAAFTASPDAPEGVKAAIDAIIAGVASSSSGAKK